MVRLIWFHHIRMKQTTKKVHWNRPDRNNANAIDIWPIYTQPSDRRLYTLYFFDYCAQFAFVALTKWLSHDDCSVCYSTDKIWFLCFALSHAVHNNNNVLGKCILFLFHNVMRLIIVKWQTIDLRISFITFSCYRNHQAIQNRFVLFVFVFSCVCRSKCIDFVMHI